MISKILTSVAAVAGAAVLTLATMIALVQSTSGSISITDVRLRVLAVCADLVLGTMLLVACIYLATRLAVRILGVGHAEFPAPPESTDRGNTHNPHSAHPPKN